VQFLTQTHKKFLGKKNFEKRIKKAFIFIFVTFLRVVLTFHGAGGSDPLPMNVAFVVMALWPALLIRFFKALFRKPYRPIRFLVSCSTQSCDTRVCALGKLYCTEYEKRLHFCSAEVARLVPSCFIRLLYFSSFLTFKHACLVV